MRCEYNCYVREHGAAARKGRKMNPSVFRIKLDLHGRMPGAVLRISEGDTARRLVCELCEDGRAYVFSDETYVIFEAIKPDGSTVAGDAAVIGASRIEYGIPSAAVSTRGTVSCCFKLYGADGLILTTPTFNIIVTEEVYDTDYPEGTDSFKALDGLITHTLDVIEKASTSASAADASASAAEASAAASQDSASEAAASAATAASNAAGATAAAQGYADAAALSAQNAASKLNACNTAVTEAKKYAMGQVQTISGATPALFCAEGIRYVCSDRVTTLTVYSLSDCSIEFVTGSTVSVTLPSGCRFATAEPIYKPGYAYVLYFEPFTAAGQSFYKASFECLGAIA